MSTKAYAEQVRVWRQEEPLPLLPVMARAPARVRTGAKSGGNHFPINRLSNCLRAASVFGDSECGGGVVCPGLALLLIGSKRTGLTHTGGMP